MSYYKEVEFYVSGPYCGSDLVNVVEITSTNSSLLVVFYSDNIKHPRPQGIMRAIVQVVGKFIRMQVQVLL